MNVALGLSPPSSFILDFKLIMFHISNESFVLMLALSQKKGTLVLSLHCRNSLALHREWVLAHSSTSMQMGMES
jgi:hypothetical protein